MQDPESTQVSLPPIPICTPLMPLETRSGTMQVLCPRDGPAHIAPEAAPPTMRELPRGDERPRRGEHHHPPGTRPCRILQELQALPEQRITKAPQGAQDGGTLYGSTYPGSLASRSQYLVRENLRESPASIQRSRQVSESWARERGYDPSISMQLKEEYVVDPPNAIRPRGRPKKRKPEDDLDPALVGAQNSSPRAPPGYVSAESLPPGNWNFMTPGPTGYTMT